MDRYQFIFYYSDYGYYFRKDRSVDIGMHNTIYYKRKIGTEKYIRTNDDYPNTEYIEISKKDYDEIDALSLSVAWY